MSPLGITIQHRKFWQTRTVVLFVAIFLSTTLLAFFFYFRSQSLLRNQIKDHLRSYAALASMQFNAANIEAIHTEDDMQSAAFESVTKKLYEIRSALPDVEYVYLMRRSDDPHKMTFISDADLFISPNGVDENHNGVIESNEEPSLPGTPYDIADAPALINAFYGPTTDDDFTTDQWGTFISGYAPVRDNTGRVVAILGIDMNDANFLRVSHSMFTPSLLFLVLLLGLMLSLYVGVANWKRKIEMYKELEDERQKRIISIFLSLIP
jgi:hypothetical protein